MNHYISLLRPQVLLALNAASLDASVRVRRYLKGKQIKLKIEVKAFLSFSNSCDYIAIMQ